jgi:N-methylhydantoinase A
MKENKLPGRPFYRLAVDTGGTFTDICLARDDTGEIFTAKIPSTPSNPAQAVLEGVVRILRDAGAHPEEVKSLLHGTTVTTNAILENKGTKSALITTGGFRDILLIGRQNRPDLYNFWASKPKPLIRRRHIFEIRERILACGIIEIPLDERQAAEVVEKIKSLGIKSIAVCFLHSYINPSHERQMASIIHRIHPEASITLSSDILPEFREYERTCAAVINTALQPLLTGYLERLEKGLDDLSAGRAGQKRTGLFIMQSNGGVITAGQAKKEAARTVLSGPAGGVTAGVQLSRRTGRPNLITFDMGGTSMDICLIRDGQPGYTSEGQIGGYPLRLPMLDIYTIGAGGGSIAWIDPGLALRVGPVSAGAAPGPACYGAGGEEPTVTDANLLLGRLNPKIAAEKKSLNYDLARSSILEKIARPLNITLEEAGEGIITVVNAAMTRAIRVITVQKGYDPRDFALVAFGGAGPLHAAELARELNMAEVIIPPYPGVNSAMGMLFSDVRRDFVNTLLKPLSVEEAENMERLYRSMEQSGSSELQNEGFQAGEIYFIRQADLRYHGQSFELTLEVPAGPLYPEDLVALEHDFHQAHKQKYGSSRENAVVELVVLRLSALARLSGISASPEFDKTAYSDEGAAPFWWREVIFWGKTVSTPIYRRQDVKFGQKIEGPAIIEQEDTTTLIWPGMSARPDKWSNLIINVNP